MTNNCGFKIQQSGILGLKFNDKLKPVRSVVQSCCLRIDKSEYSKLQMGHGLSFSQTMAKLEINSHIYKPMLLSSDTFFTG